MTWSNATYIFETACASNRRTSTGSVPPQFDPIATAQIVALVDDSDSVFKLPEWAKFSQNKKNISNKTKVAELITKAHDSLFGQDDALLLMRAAVILGKCCLQKHKLFSGSFAPDCLTSPMPEELRSFINIIIQGTSILH